ncbi:hypothetical protein ACLB2K_038697 [Fragaria x ananassa]
MLIAAENKSDIQKLKGLLSAEFEMQNGVAERMNQTLLERARCMLSNAGLERRFWVEAVSTACYLINRGPHTGIHLKTPYEMWSGKSADYSNLRVFGCTAYYHVSEGKLEPRAKKGVFVGYGDGVKGNCSVERQVEQQVAEDESASQKKQHGKASDTAVVAEVDTNSEEDLALVADAHTHHRDVWILDTGASYHICPRREWFSTYEQIDGGNISMADSSACKVVGIGSIKIRTHDGKFCTLNDVRHAPRMTKNLISLGLLDSKGFRYKGSCGVLNVYKGSNVVLKGVKRGTLYFLQGSTLSGSAAVASSEVHKDDMTKLWHMRLGHMSERGMQILSQHDLLSGHKAKDLGFCEHCIFGKLHRRKFPKAIDRTKGTLDYIHSDCWGHSRVDSLGGHRYFVSMIDDYSRMTWVFVMKHKNDAFKNFKQ